MRPMAYLEVLNGPEVGQRALLVSETFFIGREPNNHLILSDRTVSRKHAVINRIDGRFTITDLKSLKGLLVNGVKTGERALEDGDEIALGAVRIRFFADKEDALTPLFKKRSPFKFWLAGAMLVLAAIGTFFYLFPEKFPRFPGKSADSPLVESHYNRGIELFNVQRDTAGARKEFEKVLELDPKRKTVFGQKASKLLENLPKE